MASNKRVVWELGFVPDKNGLDQVKKLLTEITNAAKEPGAQMNKELQSAATAASQLKGILHKAWNSELGQLNLNKMKDAINSTYGSVGQLKTALTQCGDVGTRAFNGFASQVLNTNLHIKKSSKLLNDMATTFSNTVRYGISSSVFNRMANEISRAYDFSVQLDKSLNDIRIVTDKSANDMAKFAVQANKAAKAMGASTRDYTEASLIYFQQGLSDEEVKARTDVTIKAANVTAQATADVSEQLTAVWNGYKVSADEAELYIDKLAKVAAETAADLNELSVGMSKVASAANNAGVDIDQMNAMLATVVSVTREAPETIGTSFRTLFARMGDLKLGATDEDGVGLGKVSSQLDAIGVKVLDQQGNMRNMGDVIEDLAAKWQTLTQAQQQAAAVAIGGKMQYSRLIALMDNWDMYTRTLETSRNAAGELQKEQDIYMQSTEAHLQKLKTEAERTYNTLFDMDVVNGFSDSLTGLLGVFNNFLEGLGGGTNAVLFFGSTLANVFSEQIGRGIETQIENIEAFKANLDAAKVKESLIQEITKGYKAEGIDVSTDAGKAKVEEEANVAQRILDIKQALTEEEQKQLTIMQKQMGEDKEKMYQAEHYMDNVKGILNVDRASLNTLQKKSEEIKKQVKESQKQITVGEELVSILYDDTKSNGEIFTEFEKILSPEVQEQLGVTKEKFEAIKNAISSGDQKTALAEINQIMIPIEQSLNEQVDTEEKINKAIEGRKILESGEYDQIKARNEAQKAYLEQLEQQKARQIAIQESVKLISSLAASITAISGIIKTINDDSLSLEDKISRIVPVVIGLLTTAIPMIISLPKSLGAISVGLGLVEKGTMKNTLATGSWGAALWTALAPILPIILGVAAALALVTAAVYLGIKAWNKDAEAAENATKNLEAVTEAYNKAKEAADNLRESISNYDEALESLEKLKKGTEEYAKALEKANEEAKKLIETYGLYDDYYYENGIIKFNDGVLEDAQARADKAVNLLGKERYAAQGNAAQARLTSNITNLTRSVDSDSKRIMLSKGKSTVVPVILNKEQTKDIVDKLRNVKDTNGIEYSDITKSSQAFEEWIAKTYKGTENMKILADEIGKSVSGFRALVTETEEVENSLSRYAKQINLADLNNKYGNQISDIFSNSGLAEQALNLFNDTKVEKAITTAKEDYRNKNNPLKDWTNGFGEDLTDVGVWSKGKQQGWITKVLKGEGVSDKELLDLFGITEIKTEQDLADAWAKANNIDLSKAYFNKKEKKYVNDAGETLVDVSSAEARAQKSKTLTEIGLNEHYDNEWDNSEAIQEYELKIVNTFQKLSEKAKEGGKKFGTDFTSAAMNYLSNPDKELDLSSFAGEITPSERDQIEMMSNEDVSKLFGLTPDVLNPWVEKTAEQVGWDLKNAIHNIPWDIDKAIDKEFANIQDTLPEDLSNKKFAKYTDDLKDYTKYLMEISDGTEDAADSSNDLANSLKEDAKAAVLVANSIVRMNSGIDKLADNQEEWIKTLKKSGVESKEYYDALSGLRDAFEDLFDLSEDAADRLGGDFFQKNAELIEQAATGSEEAIEKLRNLASEAIFIDILVDNKISGEEYNHLLSNLEALQNEIPDIVVGTNINFDDLDTSHDDFLNSCQDIIESAHMTAEQARAFLESIGFEPTFKMTEHKQEVQKPITVTDTVNESYTDYDGPEPVFHEKKRTFSYVDGYTPVEETTLIPAMSSDGSDPTPTITSLVRKGTGSFNNYSSKNKGGGSPGKSSKSGGGGSSKKAAEEKKNKDEINRYQKVNSQLTIISNTLSDIEKKKSKAFGADYIKELNKELETLNQQLQLTDEKLNIQKDEQRELQQKLGAQGLIFAKSAEGEEDEQYILNYQEIWNTKHDNLNNTIALYNKMSEEEQQAFKKTLEAVQEDWQNFTKDVQHYDTLLNDLHSSMSTKEDIRRKEIAENIEKFNLEIEIRLDMMDAAKDWDSFRRDVLDDWNELWDKESFSEGYFDNKKWKSNLIRTAKEDFDLLNAYFNKEFTSAADGSKIYGSGLVKAQTEHLSELIGEAQKAFDKNTNGLFEDEAKTAMDNLKNYKEQAMNTARDIKQKIEDIKAAYLGMLKEASEKFDEQADMLGRVEKFLEHDAKLIKLIYGENQYESLEKYYQKQHDNNIQQLDFAKGQVDFWKKQMDLAAENSDEWKYAKEQWLAALDDASSKLEEAVELAKEKWENAIDSVFEKMDRKFTNGLGLDYIKEEWSLINKNVDEYLDSINSAYGIQKLQNKYLDAIDNTSSVGNQRKLNDLMNSEISSLQQIDRLTQTDLDRAELKYQIALKQMELEEVQSNKTSMRLRRDAQGNYSYQFVANNEDIDKAKEELEDLKNQLYNFDLKAYRENLDKAATAYEEYMSKMAEAAKIVDPAERAAKEKLIQEEYLEYIGMLQEENERYRLNLIESAIDEQIQLNQLEKEDFINATDEKINKVMNDLVPQWDSGVQQMMDKWSGPGGFKDTTEEAIDALMTKDEEYRQDLDEIQRVADVDFNAIYRTMEDTRLNALEPYIATNDELLSGYEKQVEYIRDTLIPQLGDLQDEYWDLIKVIEEANRLQGVESEKAAEKAREAREEVINNTKPEEAKPTVTPEAEAPADNQNNVSKASSEEGDGRLDIGDSVTYTGGPYYETSYGEGKHGTRGPGKLVKVTGIASGRPYPIHVKSSDSAYGWLREDQLTGYDTGGYTGEWGTNGRLAMLHQKELVLNAEDTSNFLNALDIMRNIVGNIGSDAFARLAAIGGNRSLGEPGAGIEQNVVINADFPNATDHNEIQQAFDNLMNIATQRVNRNRI